MNRPAIAALIIAVSSAATHAQITLKPSFKEGSTWAQRIEVKTEQTLTLNENAVESASTQFMNVRSTVGERDADGLLPVKYKFDSLQVEGHLFSIPFSFDSFNPQKPAEDDPLKAFFDLFTALYNARWTVTLDEENQIEDVTLHEDENVDLPTPFQALYEAEYFKESFAREIARLPDEPVKVGDSWTRREPTRLGGGQVMTLEVEYTYAGTARHNQQDVHKITGVVKKVDFTQDPNQAAGPLYVARADLKAEQSEIVILFDPKVGQVVESRSTLRVTGPMTMQAPNNKIPSKLDLRMQITSQCHP